MAAKFLHIGFLFPLLQKIEQMDALINAAGDEWIRYAPYSWIVWTNRSAAEWFSILRPHIALDDQVLIVELNLRERAGWLAKWIWEWIDNKRLGQEMTLDDILSQYAPPKSIGDGGPKGLGGFADLFRGNKPR